MWRALLIEESPALRTTCSEYLQSRGIDTFTARGLSDARALLPALKPDVTALDIDLEEGDGLQLIEVITGQGSRCLILSVRDQVQDRMHALSLGADGYLLKPINLEELYLRMRNILTNRRPERASLNSAVVDFNGVKVDLVTRSLLNRGGLPGPELTEMELALLRVLTENINRTVSKETLFDSVYERPYSPGARSLDVAISRLRIKLKATDIGAKIRSVREAGYLLSREGESAQVLSGNDRRPNI
jgi:DNA-binding response OmpR family regulator